MCGHVDAKREATKRVLLNNTTHKRSIIVLHLRVVAAMHLLAVRSIAPLRRQIQIHTQRERTFKQRLNSAQQHATHTHTHTTWYVYGYGVFASVRMFLLSKYNMQFIPSAPHEKPEHAWAEIRRRRHTIHTHTHTRSLLKWPCKHWTQRVCVCVTIDYNIWLVGWEMYSVMCVERNCGDNTHNCGFCFIYCPGMPQWKRINRNTLTTYCFSNSVIAVVVTYCIYQIVSSEYAFLYL